MKIAILGPYPPPYGGISTHVQRLKEQLEQRGIDCTVYDYTGMSKHVPGVVVVRSRAIWFLGQLVHSRARIIHCHGYSPMALILLSLLKSLKRKNVILSPHGFLFSNKPVGLWHRIAFWLAAKVKLYFIAESLRTKDLILSLGVKPENIHDEIIPAFIPPSIRDGEIAQVPKQVWDFIDSHSPVITANAYKISFHNNQDLYGIDLCIELCANLKPSYPNLGFVFCLPSIGDHKYFHQMVRRIEEEGIKNNFLFVTQPCPYYPILRKSDVFTRPTNTDGDANSLREALYFKVPSVASDVAARPEGTILFKNRDVDDFTAKVRHILDDYESSKERLETVKLEDNFEKLLRLLL